MSPLFVLIFLLNLTYTVRTNEVTYTHKTRHLLLVPIQPLKVEEERSSDEQQQNEPIIVLNNKNDQPPKLQVAKVQDVKNAADKPEEPKKTNSTTVAPVKNETEHKVIKTTQMESGALLRGVSVVVLFTTIVLIYMALKTYCRKKGKSPLMVNKYGVRTRRSDIEMTPLPLSEDEDDETLFDVNTTNR